jgi:hypothetical protein
MRETKTEAEHWFESAAVSVERYFFFSSLALVVIFAWMEPAGSAGIGFGKGLVFWTIQISILIPLLITVQHLASHYVTLNIPHTPWIQTALSGVVGAMLFVPIAYFLDVVFAIPEDESSSHILFGLLDDAAGVVLPVTVTWLALNAPWILQLDFSRRLTEPATQEPNPQVDRPTSKTGQPTRFLEELRRRTSGELISISSELHYVRVVTTDDEIMFLFNLKDALEELPSDAGVQIHRSHWVAKAHVRGITKRNGISECALSNGKRLPVSRRKYSEVKNLVERLSIAES